MNHRITLTLLAFIFSTSCIASTVYKYTDKDGNIVYSDTKPQGETDSESIKIKEPANQFNSQNDNQKAMQAILNRQANQDAKQQAREKETSQKRQAARKTLKDAEKAAIDAKVIREGDMFPLPSGGTRYSEQYQQRIEAAEQAVSEAQKAYNKAK